MSNVVALKPIRKNRAPQKTAPDFKMFAAISEIWGADFDKILFDKDEKESKKLQREVNKENLRFQSDLIK